MTSLKWPLVYSGILFDVVWDIIHHLYWHWEDFLEPLISGDYLFIRPFQHHLPPKCVRFVIQMEKDIHYSTTSTIHQRQTDRRVLLRWTTNWVNNMVTVINDDLWFIVSTAALASTPTAIHFGLSAVSHVIGNYDLRGWSSHLATLLVALHFCSGRPNDTLRDCVVMNVLSNRVFSCRSFGLVREL